MTRLSGLDGLVVLVYLTTVVAMAAWIARRQRSGTDYFLAGRAMTGTPLAMSLLANQLSAVSLVGAPAFVAVRPGGGLSWLQYELALPLAMLLLIVLVLPHLRTVAGASIYEFLGGRFGRPTRRVLAVAFLVSRGLALGVVLYASALVVATVFDTSPETAILWVGVFSVAYTSLGGIAADIWSDVLQLIVLWTGTILSCGYLLFLYGDSLLAAVPADRMRVLVLDSAGLAPGEDFAFLPMFFGGLFLYLSYYGCDQSQAQRLLAARDDRSARRALLWNGLLRFPLVLTYCGFGLLLAGLLQVEPTFAAAMREHPADSLVPVFMVQVLPSGLRGVFVAAVFAAAMSSIDSALNSLAAVTLDDVFDLGPAQQSVWLSRGVSLLWGLIAIVSGLAFARSERTVIELINLIGSAFYGPVLAVFALAIYLPGSSGRAVLTGFFGGLGCNLAVSALTSISWLWWNPLGFAATVIITRLGTVARPVAVRSQWPVRETTLLAGFLALVLAAFAVLELRR
jgi:sodium-coupled monocarboxylate transporter 8/12